MELLKNFTLTEGSHKFVFIPYQENMDIRQVLAQTKKQKPHRIVWLKNLFTQSGCEWLDYLAEHINLRVADLRNGDGYITAVATVKELRSIIQNAYKQQLLRQRETENIVEELKAIPTEKVLILITTGRLDYTTLEETVLREQFDNTLRKLDDDIPETGFVEYNQGYLRRGSVFQLSDGKRAVAFNGFHLGGETVEQSTAIQAIVMGKDCITDVSESFLWVISDTGMQANQNTVKIHPEYVMSEIDKLASDDAIFTVDTGMTCVWGARYLQATGKRHMLGSFNHGSMANALPQAIGAALAYPDRQVVALCGDGGLSMTLGDLETVVQYKLPIKIIVFNNRSLGMVKLEMEVDGLPDWQTNMLNPDFAQVAEAMGMTGFNVSNPEEVLTTLLNAFELDGPVLVNIMTDPNALAMPPKIELGQMVGFAQSMYKLLINGRSQEVIDTINSNYKHIREVF